MREELGMFKHEQALTSKAMHVEPLLGRRREFQRKGERRQRALLTNEAFPMALRFAQTDFYLGGEDLLYWTEAYAQLREHTPLSTSGAKRKRRRPRRTGPRGPRVIKDTDEVRN